LKEVHHSLGGLDGHIYYMYNIHTTFEFDPRKEEANVKKHGIHFEIAKQVFLDPNVIYLRDVKHSRNEDRWHAVGRIPDGRIITVWFTWREDVVRLIGAAEFRSGREAYEKGKRTGLVEDEEG